MSQQSGLGEQALNKAAEIGLASQLDESEFGSGGYQNRSA